MVKNESNPLQDKGMPCPRCNGWMGFEKFYGPHYAYFGWHCLLCGNLLDPVILLNRLRPRSRVSSPDKKEELIARFKEWTEAWPEPV